MILVPYLPFRRAAEALETGDLQLNIVSIKREMDRDAGVWNRVTLAEYGLTSLKVLGSRGFRSDNYYNSFKDAYKGIPVEPPLWVKDYCEKHRAYLVLLGWLRHFEDRGAKAYWCEKNGVEPPLNIVKRNKKPLAEFKALDSRLTALGLFERPRQYYKFSEEPEVVPLSPHSSQGTLMT